MPDEFGLLRPSANGRPAPTEKRSLRRRRPTPGAQAPEKADFNRREGLRPTAGLRRPKNVLCAGEGQRLARGAPNEFSLLRPSADGRPAPAKDVPCIGEGRRLARGAPNEFSLLRPSANGRPAPTEKRSLRRRGRRLARGAPNEFGLLRPSADGRPAPTEKRSLRRRRPTPGASRLGRPISIGGKAFSQRPACAGQRRSLRRRRPTPGASRPERPISIGAKVDGPCLTRRGPARP
jgi:hypothetical protein